LISNSSLLQNEAAFGNLFCDVISGKDFSLYYNSNFWDDPIFNHATFSGSLLDSGNYSSSEAETTFKEIIEEARRIGVPASLFQDRFWKNSKSLEKDAIDFGFLIIEQMHILKKSTQSPALEVANEITVQSTSDVKHWNRAFIKSFAIPQNWIIELERRLARISEDPKTVLLVATEKGSPEASGCSLLHIDPVECMGVYSVGTVPERRGHGVARALMATAEIEAKNRNCEAIVLQTIASDGVAPMYLKMGYETVFERDVLQFRG
jgi:GNAT superfamily N-acetyltransferase